MTNKPWEKWEREGGKMPNSFKPVQPSKRLRQEMLEDHIFVDVKDGAQFKVNFVGGTETDEELREGIEGFRRIVGRGSALDNDRTLSVKRPLATDRSYYRLDEETIYMAKGEKADTMVHEMGHWFEQHASIAAGKDERYFGLQSILQRGERGEITKEQQGQELNALLRQYPSTNNPVAAARRRLWFRRAGALRTAGRRGPRGDRPAGCSRAALQGPCETGDLSVYARRTVVG